MDSYGYHLGELVEWNQLVIKHHDPKAIGVVVGLPGDGKLDILMEGAAQTVSWNQIKPMGFKSKSQQERNEA